MIGKAKHNHMTHINHPLVTFIGTQSTLHGQTNLCDDDLVCDEVAQTIIQELQYLIFVRDFPLLEELLQYQDGLAKCHVDIHSVITPEMIEGWQASSGAEKGFANYCSDLLAN